MSPPYTNYQQKDYYGKLQTFTRKKDILNASRDFLKSGPGISFNYEREDVTYNNNIWIDKDI